VAVATPRRAGGNVSRDDARLLDQTLDLANELRVRFRLRNQLYALIDSVIYGDTYIEIPEAYRKTALEMRSPLAIDIVDTTVSALCANPPTVQYQPTAFGDAAQQNATLREHFFDASWQRQEQDSRRPLLRSLMYSTVAKGEGVLKTISRANSAWREYSNQAKAMEEEIMAEQRYDADAQRRLFDKETEQLKLLAPYPIASTDVPPETFYYNQNENGFTACVEVKTMPYLEALARFGTGLDRDGNVLAPDEWQSLDPRAMALARSEWPRIIQQHRQITVIEAWDYQTCSIVLLGPGQLAQASTQLQNGTLVRQIKHGYGDPVLKTLRGPYFLAHGLTTSSRLPERAGISILYGYLMLFPLIDSLLTMQGNSAFLTGWPAFKRTTPPGQVPGIQGGVGPYANDNRDTDATQRIQPGMVYPFDIGPIEQPKAGQDLDKVLQNAQTMAMMAQPEVIRGGAGGAQSGYQLNQQAFLARLKWDPIVGNVSQALADRCSFESWLIERRIGETVYAFAEERPPQQRGRYAGQTRAGWIGIGPDDLSGVHRYKVRLDISTPSDDVVATRAIGEKMQLKLITYEQACRDSGSNPDEVEKSWLLQNMKQSGPVQQKLMELTFQKLGTILAAQMGGPGPTPQEMAGVTPAGMAGGMVPGGVGNPPPGGPGVGGGAGGIPPPGAGGPVPPTPGPGPGPGSMPGQPATPTMPNAIGGG
jgi:hypothetical protein